jgi:hypothetical protein
LKRSKWDFDMDTKRKTTESIAIAILLLFCATHAMGAETRPNIILIFVDDLGYCDTELYGCDRVPTPNIKRIAEQGVLFTDGYVSSPVCSQSRAGLLTGRHQQRFGHEFLPSVYEKNSAGLPVKLRGGWNPWR